MKFEVYSEEVTKGITSFWSKADSKARDISSRFGMQGEKILVKLGKDVVAVYVNGIRYDIEDTDPRVKRNGCNF
jgi:hypothetical protein